MLELVNTIEDLVRNVRQYQKVSESNRINPSLVRRWYYIPTLGMVGASRFIGYRNMTVNRYDESEEIDGKMTEKHLQGKGWFCQLTGGMTHYASAYRLAESLDKQGRVNNNSRFYVLKDIYDKQIRK